MQIHLVKRKGEKKPHRISVKKEVLVKQKYKCFNCGDMLPAKYHIYYKDGDRTNNRLSNLFALCPNCHVDYHQI